MSHAIVRTLLLAALYIIPVLFIISSLKRVYGIGKKPPAQPLPEPPPAGLPVDASAEPETSAPPAAEPGQARGIRGRYSKAVIYGPLIIFITFLLARIFAPKYIFARGLQSAIFHNVWIYVLIILLPLCLGGLAYGLWALNTDRGKGWPIFLIFGSLATLFVVSVFAVLLLAV